ncbi:hypothetical protein M758_N026600 [Ceratodon purpureus]|nr:hypothetical protein M758_N028600 [Ceratodon purpureus]KAG0504684.1 hypothetical protein M758_N026600 [Ceratodon purpureus]
MNEQYEQEGPGVFIPESVVHLDSDSKDLLHVETLHTAEDPSDDTEEGWTPNEESRDTWDNLEHVAPEIPTTWNVLTSTPDEQDVNSQEDLGMYLGLDLSSQVEARFFKHL